MIPQAYPLWITEPKGGAQYLVIGWVAGADYEHPMPIVCDPEGSPAFYWDEDYKIADVGGEWQR